MTDSISCWIRGVSFVTVFAPIAGAAVITILVVAADPLQGVSCPGGVLNALVFFLVASVVALPLAGPVALVVGLFGTSFAIRWAKSGVPPQSLGPRFKVLGLVLGSASGIIVGLIVSSTEDRWSDTLTLFLPAGLVVGVFLGILVPRVLGQPYRRLTSG